MAALPELGCVPDLQPASPPCTGPATVSYTGAPGGLVTDMVAASVDRFEALSGTVKVDVLCEADWGGASTAELTITPAPLKDLEVVSDERAACARGRVLWAGTVALRGASLGGLDGMSSAIGGSNPSYFVAPLDASYDPRLSAVWMQGFLGGGDELATLEFALQPTTSADGHMTTAGHECVLKRHQ